MIAIGSLFLTCALAGAGDVVMLDFWANGCGPCLAMMETVDRMVVEGYPIRKVNIRQERQLAAQFNVTSVPCFIVLREGRVAARRLGRSSPGELASMFEKAGYRKGGGAIVRGQSPDPPPTLPRRPPVAPSQPRPALWPEGRSPALPKSLTPQGIALQATVRLKVEDSGGHSLGTGTIIDVHGDTALVLTCGHIFRESKGRGRILVELCADESRPAVEGRLLDFDSEKLDVALVTIRPGMNVTPSRVASTSYRPSKGAEVFSVGCDHGGAARLVASRLTGINKYDGPDNFEVAGKPAEGRSGGGLFERSGRLIGVCNALDNQDDEGIYAALPSVHRMLDRNGLRRLYESPTADTKVAVNPPSSLGRSPFGKGKPGAETGLKVSSDKLEVIVVIKSKRGTHRETIIVENPSRQLLEQLRSAGHRGAGF